MPGQTGKGLVPQLVPPINIFPAILLADNIEKQISYFNHWKDLLLPSKFRDHQQWPTWTPRSPTSARTNGLIP